MQGGGWKRHAWLPGLALGQAPELAAAQTISAQIVSPIRPDIVGAGTVALIFAGLAVFATDHVAGDKVQEGLEGNDRGRGRKSGAGLRMVRLPPAQLIPDHPLLRVEQRLANQEMSVVHGRPWAGCRA